jgi:hypothetical protein
MTVQSFNKVYVTRDDFSGALSTDRFGLVAKAVTSVESGKYFPYLIGPMGIQPLKLPPRLYGMNTLKNTVFISRYVNPTSNASICTYGVETDTGYIFECSEMSARKAIRGAFEQLSRQARERRIGFARVYLAGSPEDRAQASLAPRSLRASL